MTTKEDISRWFDCGLEKKADFMIVVCDTFDHEDYPVYASLNDFDNKYKSHDRTNMQRIMEVYDLSMDKDTQMAEHPAFHLPTDRNKPVKPPRGIVVRKGLTYLPESAQQIRLISELLKDLSKEKKRHLGDVLALLADAISELTLEHKKIKKYFEAEKKGMQ